MELSFLYRLSEWQVEVYINENTPTKFIVGLAMNQKSPDHSTLAIFPERMPTRGKLEVFKEMLD